MIHACGVRAAVHLVTDSVLTGVGCHVAGARSWPSPAQCATSPRQEIWRLRGVGWSAWVRQAHVSCSLPADQGGHLQRIATAARQLHQAVTAAVSVAVAHVEADSQWTDVVYATAFAAVAVRLGIRFHDVIWHHFDISRLRKKV